MTIFGWSRTHPLGFAFDPGLFDGDLYVLVLDIEAQTVEEAHVDVRHPDEGKPGYEIAAPTFVEHLESGDEEESGGDVVAEAVLASEKVEEFAGDQGLAVLASVFAPLAGFAEDLFVGDGPGDAGDGDRQQKKIRDLAGQGHQHGGRGDLIGRMQFG
ncbi:MAG: hypothetical protein JWM43_2022 [Acidobacteriaceae bacterium]|nr:hypothetical protein [Acidobacteriaceae bacterium]